MSTTVWSQIKPVLLLYFVGVAALDFEIGLGASDKETACIAQSKKAFEIDVAAIHHIESAGLDNQLVEQVDFVPLAIADMNKRRDIASQVQQCVQLDRRLGRTERCQGNTDRHRSMVVASRA